MRLALLMQPGNGPTVGVADSRNRVSWNSKSVNAWKPRAKGVGFAATLGGYDHKQRLRPKTVGNGDGQAGWELRSGQWHWRRRQCLSGVLELTQGGSCYEKHNRTKPI